MANYGSFWLAYLAAAAVFLILLWRFAAFPQRVFLNYSLRAFFLALLLTPWTANTNDPYFAPALMVMTLDTITLGSQAGLRAFVPLFVALVCAQLIATILWLRSRRALRDITRQWPKAGL